MKIENENHFSRQRARKSIQAVQRLWEEIIKTVFVMNCRRTHRANATVLCEIATNTQTVFFYFTRRPVSEKTPVTAANKLTTEG